ncbi:MAG: hypothetical protein JO312_26665 [Hyphomicrobiales bacterium]|nr:hypothetical protein [Hyphomicrobiales bacterium]
MKKSGEPPRLTVVEPGATGVEPPRPLGEHGRRLWDQVHREYQVDDVAGVELLAQAAAALDRAESLAGRIQEDGELLRTPSGLKCHPAIREELSARGFVVRTMMKLGLNFEPLRTSIGRPPGKR